MDTTRTLIERVPPSETNRPSPDTALSLIVDGGWEGTYWLCAQFMLSDVLSEGVPVEAIVYDGDLNRYVGMVVELSRDQESLVFADGVSVELSATTSIHI